MHSQSTDSGAQTVRFCVVLSRDGRYCHPTQKDVLFLLENLQAHNFGRPFSALESYREAVLFENEAETRSSVVLKKFKENVHHLMKSSSRSNGSF